MSEEYFTEEEARELKGERVKTNIEFSGIAKGTVGKVNKIDSHDRPAKENDWTICVKWESKNGNMIEDWFTKDEFDEYMEVV